MSAFECLICSASLIDASFTGEHALTLAKALGFSKNLDWSKFLENRLRGHEDETEESTSSLELELFQRGTYCPRCVAGVKDLTEIFLQLEEFQKMVAQAVQKIEQNLRQSFQSSTDDGFGNMEIRKLRKELILALEKRKQGFHSPRPYPRISFESSSAKTNSGHDIDNNENDEDMSMADGDDALSDGFDAQENDEVNTNQHKSFDENSSPGSSPCYTPDDPSYPFDEDDISEVKSFEEEQQKKQKRPKRGPPSPKPSFNSLVNFDQKFLPIVKIQKLQFPISKNNPKVQPELPPTSCSKPNLPTRRFNLRSRQLGRSPTPSPTPSPPPSTSSIPPKPKVLKGSSVIKPSQTQPRQRGRPPFKHRRKLTKRELLANRKKRDRERLGTRIDCTVPGCTRRFKPDEEYRLKAHIKKIHEGINRCYICDTCGTSFYEGKELLLHNQTHQGITNPPRPCNYCELTFRDKSELRKHKESMHYDFFCFYCPRSFATQQILDLHVITHAKDPEEKQTYMCEHCSKIFLDKHNLIKHIKNIHPTDGTPREVFHCDQCEKTFLLQSSLNDHIKIVHKKEYNFQCDQCGFGCINAYKLDQHILQRHSDIREFVCTECDGKFKTNSALRVHMRKHTGERPFECDVCGKRFMQNPHLKRHQLLHSNEPKYECELCKQTFHVKDYLNYHMKKNHQQMDFVKKVFSNFH